MGRRGRDEVAPPQIPKNPFARIERACFSPHPNRNFPHMGSIKKKRKAKIANHKRRKRRRENRHKKRLRYKS